MKTLTCTWILFLLGATLVLAAGPAAAGPPPGTCPAPPSGTGVTTCTGTRSVPSPSTSGGPVCLNTLCPGLGSNPSPAFCAQAWANGDPVFRPDVCVPVPQPL